MVLEKMTHLTPRHVLGRSGSELEKTSGEFGLNENILDVDTDCSECMICKLSKTAAKLRPDLRGDEFHHWRLKGQAGKPGLRLRRRKVSMTC